MRYNRKAVYDYAKEWAYARNPKYYNYDSIGGDCTNFASQCVFAGCKEMNYNKNNGWYYIDGNNKSPSWTATEYLYKFLTTNKGAGPSGDVVQINERIPMMFLENEFLDTIFTNIDVYISHFKIFYHMQFFHQNYHLVEF